MTKLLTLNRHHFRIFALEIILGMVPVSITLFYHGYNDSFLKQLTNFFPSNPVAWWFISVGLFGALILIVNKNTFFIDFSGDLKIHLLSISKDFVESLKSLYTAIAGFTFAIIVIGLIYEPFSLRLLGLQFLLLLFAVTSHFLALYIEYI